MNYGCLIYTVIALGFIIIGTFHQKCNSNPGMQNNNENTYQHSPNYTSDKDSITINQ